MSDRVRCVDASHLGKLEDFKNFLYLVFKTANIINGAAAEPTPLQYDIADWLQYSPKRSITMAFRGIGKSYITAAFVCWLFLVNPNYKILVISAGEEKAKEFANLVRQLIENVPYLQHLKPRKGQRDSILSFDVGPAAVSKDSSLKVSGIGGQITGGRSDWIIPDDVEVQENSATVSLREKLLNKLSELDAIIKTNADVGIRYLGTPQCEQSIYYELVNRGYTLKVWPAQFPVNPDKYKGHLAEFITDKMRANPALVGQATDTRFTLAELKERSIGKKAWYQLQYMLDPELSDAERYPLKLRDAMLASIQPEKAPDYLAWSSDERYLVKDPEIPVVGLNGDRWFRPSFMSDTWGEYDRRLMFIDPAGKGTSTASNETAYCVLLIKNGKIFVADWGGLLGYGEGSMAYLASVAKNWKVDKVIIEENFGQGMFAALFRTPLQKVYPVGIEEVSSSGNKEKRICDTLEPIFGAHRVIFNDILVKKDYAENKEQQKQAFFQLTRITRTKGELKYDDRIDVLAIGCAYVVQDIDLDPEEAYRQAEAEEISKYMEDVFGLRDDHQSRGFADLSGPFNFVM